MTFITRFSLISIIVFAIPGRHEAIKISNGEVKWVPVDFDSYCYECRDTENTGIILDVVKESDVEVFSYVHKLCDWEVECPTLIFSYHRDKDKVALHYCGI